MPNLAVKAGRRATDWVVRTYQEFRQKTLAIFQIWKDERGWWSTRRILLWAWTLLGAWVIYREVTARVYVVNDTIITPHFLSNAWIQAWMVTEGAFIVAVFGPVVADYLKNAAPTMTAIAGSVRDSVLTRADAQQAAETLQTPKPVAFGGTSQ